MSGNGDDLSPDTVTTDPRVEPTAYPDTAPVTATEVADFHRRMAQKKADMREITEQPPPMMMRRPFKDRVQPENPEQIVDAVLHLTILTVADRALAIELLRSWCAAPRTG